MTDDLSELLDNGEDEDKTAEVTVCGDYFYVGRMAKPLGKVFHYSNRRKLKDIFNPSLTRTLQRAMVAPYGYLGDEKMKVESVDSIHSDLPDISNAYKLFTQSVI